MLENVDLNNEGNETSVSTDFNNEENKSAPNIDLTNEENKSALNIGLNNEETKSTLNIGLHNAEMKISVKINLNEHHDRKYFETEVDKEKLVRKSLIQLITKPCFDDNKSDIFDIHIQVSCECFHGVMNFVTTENTNINTDNVIENLPFSRLFSNR